MCHYEIDEEDPYYHETILNKFIQIMMICKKVQIFFTTYFSSIYLDELYIYEVTITDGSWVNSDIVTFESIVDKYP